ncbi:unnamed protein product [Cuscuta campestris]|uniref:Regulator of chromosome condensation 1/beta-lactamase-inhibitor protein II n=1 Tax=Cuscuta campestris TaxID=132261 RepID=A0A484LWQ5_9ASTE|nr:unnamed protein product [Cuscuta campestris]
MGTTMRTERRLVEICFCVAVDSNGHVYTWGFGGYVRLGHREKKDEWAPRRVDGISRQNVLPPDVVILAGSVNSSCIAGGGQLYVWGKNKEHWG